MGRPPKAIRIRRDSRTGRYLVGFLEEPTVWHTSPEEEEGRALSWARRNKGRLLASSASKISLSPFLKDFFKPGSPWVKRAIEKGHSFGAAYLIVRQGHLDNYVDPIFGACDPRELTGRYIDDALLEAPRAHKGGKPLAPATKYKILFSFHLVLLDLLEQGIISSDPLANIKPYSKAPVSPRGAIPKDALEKLFPSSHGELVKVWGNPMWAAAMLVLADTGLRPGELRALRWKELREQNRAAVIRYGIEAGTVATVKGTKTGIVKPAFLSQRTAQELSIWKAESRYSGADQFIFSLDGIAPVTNEGLTKAFRRGLENCGIDAKWTPYWLRHSFGTYHLAELEDSELLMLMGHTNIITSAIYRHPDDALVLERAKEARRKLEEARKGQ